MTFIIRPRSEGFLEGDFIMFLVLKTVIVLCNIITGLSIYTVIKLIVMSFIENHGCLNVPSLKELNPYQGLETKKDYVVVTSFLLCIIVSLVNFTLSLGLSSTQIGTFYEKAEYEEDYEATLYIDNKSVFCIAHLIKNSEPEITHTISKISFPYGKSQYLDERYDPNYENNEVSLSDWDIECKIILTHPVTQTSWEILQNEVVSNYGEFCGSKESDTFHLLSCPQAKKIKKVNLVYFSSYKEAVVLGYEFCDSCHQKYSY